MRTEPRRSIELFVGVLLVAVGGVLLLARGLFIEVGRYGWPLFVIVPGLLLFGLMWYFGPQAGFLAIPGSIVTTTGVVLLVANSFDAWEAWSYAWALVAPTSVGFGLWLWGTYSKNDELRRAGRVVGLIGLLLFLAFGVFFEVLLGVGVLGRFIEPTVVFAAAVILLGVWMVVRGVMGERS